MNKPVIEFENYSFQYHSQAEPTLKNINIKINQGEKVLIVGPSGSGKSTIGHTLNGLIPFSYKGDITGSLKIMGQDTKNLSVFELSKRVGTVLQDPDGQFISLTVGEDIAFALENDCAPQTEMFQVVKDVSRMVDMDNYLPQSVHDLSGGQKQRVAIAGVMVNDVEILLFDEPLANLDPATGEHVISLIEKIHKETNKTIVIIEHRLEDVLSEHVDRIIVIDRGEVVADLPPNKLLASDILEKIQIREPLYIKAAKYAGCQIVEESNPAYIKEFQVERYQLKLLDWFYRNPIEKQSHSQTDILELRNVNFRYDASREVIKNVSFKIKKGEMISIVGKNGAGKSTLSKLICGFEKLNDGQILFNGKDITNDTIKERSLRIGMVMQNPNQMISKQMIFDEVAFGLVLRGLPEEEVKEKVEETLKICGLFPYRNWPINALSFGQKKRVTIASILVLDPEVIILDEPTAGQDLRHYTDIMEFLIALNKQGKTIIMITHDMHLMLEYTPRAIAISDGQVLADESAVSILGNPEIIKKANLKETSLFTLVERLGIQEKQEFVERFISCDKKERAKWRQNY